MLIKDSSANFELFHQQLLAIYFWVHRCRIELYLNKCRSIIVICLLLR